MKRSKRLKLRELDVNVDIRDQDFHKKRNAAKSEQIKTLTEKKPWKLSPEVCAEGPLSIEIIKEIHQAPKINPNDRLTDLPLSDESSALTITPDEDFSDAVEYLEEILKNELIKDKKYVLSDAYCKNEDKALYRKVLVDWLIQIQMYTKANNSVLYTAIGLFDVVFDLKKFPPHKLHLVTLTIFWIAHKFHDRDSPINIRTMQRFSNNLDKKSILKYEQKLLSMIKFEVNIRDPLVFLHCYLYKIYQYLGPPIIYYCSQYLFEIMISNTFFLSYKMQTLIATSIYMAHEVLETDKTIIFLASCLELNPGELASLYIGVVSYLTGINTKYFRGDPCALFKKYKRRQYLKISLHPKLLEHV